MRHDDYVANGEESLDEAWANLGKWLDRFLPGNSKAMYGSADEMQRYVSFWNTELRKLAARYRDDQNNQITSRTLGQLPLPALRLFLLRVMQLPEPEVNSVMYRFNKHPLVDKTGMRLDKPLNTVYMRRAYDKDGAPSTIQSYFNRHSANPDAVKNGDWRAIEKFLDSLVAAAATRKMELDYLGDEPKTGVGKRTARGRTGDPGQDEIDSRISALRTGIEQILRM